MCGLGERRDGPLSPRPPYTHSGASSFAISGPANAL